MGFDCVARTHPGSVRELNEDAILNCGDRGLWVVADGMGGHDAGEVASAMVVEALGEFSPNANDRQPGHGVVAVLRQVNDRLKELARAEYEQRTIGSTVVGLLADDQGYTCFWAGDSRAYLARDGELVQISRDHSLVQDLVDAGMLDAEEAETHPNANVITRAVGAADLLQVDTVKGELRRGDLFLLASDGLTKLVSRDELQSELGEPELEVVADRLIELALQRGAPDNVSFVVVRVR